MKASLLAAMSVLALVAAPAFAQDRAQPSAAPSAHPDMSSMTPEQLHEHCKSVMGGQMAGHASHSHTSDKLGHAPPGAKPLSAAEMQKMHDKCAAIMAQEKGAKPKP